MMARCNLFEGAPTRHAFDACLRHLALFSNPRLPILFLDEQPQFLAGFLLSPHPDKIPDAAQLFALQAEF
jgi:hypothetical protein